MSAISYTITKEPIGFLVYAKKESGNITTSNLCLELGVEITRLLQMQQKEGGFNPEPPDALAFFLFEENAKRFISSLMLL